MDGARKVALGVVVIGALVILGPRIPSMLNTFTKGSVGLAKTTGGLAMDAYNAGVEAGKSTVMKGIAKPVN